MVVNAGSRFQQVVQDARADSETASDGAALVAPAPVEARGRARTKQLLCGSVLLSALLAACAAFTFTRLQQVADYFVSEAATTSTIVVQGSGCKNWNDIFLNYPAYSDHTQQSCAELCEQTDGCVSSNFQGDACPSNPSEQVGAGACYMYGPGCILEPNECWTLTVSGNAPAFQLNSSRTGCGNWDTAKIGDHIKVRTKDECGWHCSQNDACKQFQYQPTTCADQENTEKGACYLLSEECQMEPNACWDLYQRIPKDSVGAYTMTTQPALAGNKSVQVASVAGIVKGAVIAIIDAKGTKQQLIVTDVKAARRLAAASSSSDKGGTIEFTPALSNDCEAFSAVFVDKAAAEVTTTAQSVTGNTAIKVSGKVAMKSSGSKEQVETAAKGALSKQLGVDSKKIAASAIKKRRRLFLPGLGGSETQDKEYAEWITEWSYETLDSSEANAIEAKSKEAAADPTAAEAALKEEFSNMGMENEPEAGSVSVEEAAQEVVESTTPSADDAATSKEDATTTKEEEETTTKKEDETTSKKEEETTTKKEDETTSKKEEETTTKKDDATTTKKEEETTTKKDDATTAKKEEETTTKKDDATTTKKEEETTTKKDDATTTKKKEETTKKDDAAATKKDDSTTTKKDATTTTKKDTTTTKKDATTTTTKKDATTTTKKDDTTTTKKDATTTTKKDATTTTKKDAITTTKKDATTTTKKEDTTTTKKDATTTTKKDATTTTKKDAITTTKKDATTTTKKHETTAKTTTGAAETKTAK